MKNLYIVLSFLAIGSSIIAQNQDTKAADKLFLRYEYVKAIKEYQKLVEQGKSDNYVYKQLGDTYYNMFNTVDAIKCYAKATTTTQDAETYFRYALMLKSSGKFEESNQQMTTFALLVPNDLRAKAFKENPYYVPKLVEGTTYTVTSLPISSDKMDFGAIMYDKTLYFSSARNTSRKNYGANGEPFLDVYFSTKGDSGTYSEPTQLNSINHKGHDGPVTISADGNTMYFSSDSFRVGFYQKDKDNLLKLGRNNLFIATKSDNSWTNIKPLTFNSALYSMSNPSLSRDGKTLYFSSNMKGSIGGVDIWKVSINGEQYGKPENLGSKINTEGNESFPFIADDNTTLYFASNGKPGLGGLDIFKINLAKETEAENMGKPLNSEKDDFDFTFNKAQNIGFLSSNRNGNDDIFLATPVCSVDLIVVVSNAKTGEIVPDANVAILDSKKNIIATELSNFNGEVNFKIECGSPYSIQASKEGFEGNTFDLIKSSGPKVKLLTPLQPIDIIITPTEIVLQPIYFDFDKSNITQQGAFELEKLVQVMKRNENLVIITKSHTDTNGSDDYNLSLSNRRAQATVQYVISKGISPERITGKGFGENEPVVPCKSCTEEKNAKNRRSEFLIAK